GGPRFDPRTATAIGRGLKSLDIRPDPGTRLNWW
ncbi:hypothetical protein A2U01_0047532, partial [Trifolium medium]|nr:hypothetical protein [Trifolium medium]